MFTAKRLLLCVFLLLLSVNAYSGAATSGYTGYSWELNSNVYTFNFWINGIPNSTDQLICWEFEPANLASPGVWSSADPNWYWDSKKLALKVPANQKYIYGVSLMPGEVLTFNYTLNSGVVPKAGEPTFVAHVARTPGLTSNGNRWIDVGDTWFDSSKKEPKPPLHTVPEPSGLLAISSAIFSLGGLMRKRARV